MSLPAGRIRLPECGRIGVSFNAGVHDARGSERRHDFTAA